MNRYLKNSVFGIFQLLISIGLVFFSIPVFIKTNGLKMYGVFAVVSIFGNLTLLFNFGLNTTLLKFIAGNDNANERNGHVNASLTILGVTTVLFTILLLLFQNIIIGDFLDIDKAIQNDVVSAFRIFLAANFFIMLGQPFVAMMQAQSDYYLANILQLMYNVINWGLIILFCKLHYSFRVLSFPAAISAILWFVFLVVIAVRKYKFNILLRSRGEVRIFSIIKKQLSYSMNVYINSLLSFMNEPLLKFIVARYLGPQAVGSLDIILRIKSQVVSLAIKAIEPLGAIIAGKRSRDDARKVVHYSEQLAFLIIVPVAQLIFVIIDPLLILWMHDIAPELILHIKIVLIFFLLNTIAAPNYYYLTFHGQVKKCGYIHALVALISILAFFILKDRFGEITPVIGLCAGLSGGLILNLFYQWKYLNSLIFDRTTFGILLLVVALVAVNVFGSLNHMWLLQYVSIGAIIVISVVNIRILYLRGYLKFSELKT